MREFPAVPRKPMFSETIAARVPFTGSPHRKTAVADAFILSLTIFDARRYNPDSMPGLLNL